jgi:hypothetical protein
MDKSLLIPYISGEGRFMIRSSALVLMLLLICPLTFSLKLQVVKATAADIVVPDNYATIQGAINAASDGYAILVRNGTYYENVVVNKTVMLCGENREATVIDGNETGDCVHVTASGVRVTGFTIRNGGSRPYTAYSCVSLSSNGNSILDNNLIDSWCGVHIDDSCSYEVVDSNTIAGNLNGIAGEVVNNIRIAGNDIKNNLMGIWLGPYTSHSVVSFNNMTDSWTQGLYAYAPSYCTFEGNNITRNNQAGWSVGLTLAFQETLSYGNKLFHNNIANVGQQFDLEGGAAGQLTLDDGYPSGGNYWSLYNGTDIFRSVYQNETGSDGIGDTPNIFDATDIDRYPLMNPFGEPLSQTFSLAIEATPGGATNPAAAIYPFVNGSSIPVNATASTGYLFDHWELDSNNVGSSRPYTVLMNANHTLRAVFLPQLSSSLDIGCPTLNLKGRGEWITAYIELASGRDVADINVSTILLNGTVAAGLTPTVIGNYHNNSIQDLMVLFNRTLVIELIASASIALDNVTLTVSGQLNDGAPFEASNTIKVSSMMGDVNCNGRVSLQDLQLVANAYDSRPGDPNWNDNADFAAPWSSISLSDLVTVAVCYGQHYP